MANAVPNADEAIEWALENIYDCFALRDFLRDVTEGVWAGLYAEYPEFFKWARESRGERR